MEVKVNIIDTLFTTIPKNTVVASYTIDEDSVDLTMLNDQYSFNTANKTILTSSENIRIPSSAYPRIFAILVEIDDRAIFSTKLEFYSAKGSYIDYSTNTVMNYIGVSTTNSKVSAALSACNIHN